MCQNVRFSRLEVEGGRFRSSEIVVLLGENGTGKTTFIKMLAGKLESDDGGKSEMAQNFDFPRKHLMPYFK